MTRIDQLWGSGPDDVYGAGNDEVVHFDGASWSVVVDPTPGVWVGTQAVHGTGPGDVWVGGAGGLLVRFDGQQWDPLSSPLLVTQPGPRALWGTSADDLWAAGGGGVLYRRSASGWTALQGPTDADLRGLWGAAPDDVWAVGERALLHYDGSAWTDRTADLPGAAPTLNGVWGSGGTVIAVGDHGRIVRSTAGGAWQDEGTDVLDLLAVWGAAPDDVWAVGDLNAIYHHDGASWTRVAHPRDGEGAGELRAVRGSAPDDVWAVGRVSLTGEPATMLHFDGVSWNDRSAELPPGIGTSLHALWVDGAEVWVGGHYYGANMGHFDGTSWTAHETRAETSTMALWGDGAAVYSAGGDHGVHLMRWDR